MNTHLWNESCNYLSYQHRRFTYGWCPCYIRTCSLWLYRISSSKSSKECYCCRMTNYWKKNALENIWKTPLTPHKKSSIRSFLSISSMMMMPSLSTRVINDYYFSRWWWRWWRCLLLDNNYSRLFPMMMICTIWIIYSTPIEIIWTCSNIINRTSWSKCWYWECNRSYKCLWPPLFRFLRFLHPFIEFHI